MIALIWLPYTVEISIDKKLSKFKMNILLLQYNHSGDHKGL